MVNKKGIILLILFLFSLLIIMSSSYSATIGVNQSNATNFKNITQDIEANSNILINSDLSLDNNNVNIIINKTVTIQSNISSQKAVIDLNRYGRAFNVTSEGHLTLINITIINGRANNGGVINNDGGNITLNGCNFTDNSVTSNGWGAVIYHMGGILTVTNCIFTYNRAVNGFGGAIYNSANLNLTNCDFIDNTASYGGAIYNILGSVDLTTCDFTNNTATTNGSAIWNSASVTLTNCTFTNNKGFLTIYNDGGNTTIVIYNTTTGGIRGALEASHVIGYGNAIILLNPGTYTGSNNTNIEMDWGDIIIQGNGSANSVIIDAKRSGSIFGISGGLTVTFINITFTNSQNCAIYGAASDLNLINCIFTNNNGSAISYAWADVNLINCTFRDNEGVYGGAIYSNEANFNITNCNFTNNMATNSGGAIYSTSNTNLNVNNSTFRNNTATGGGAIENFEGNATLTNCIFINNTATGTYGFGGAISTFSGRIDLIGCNFTNNTATRSGGAIYNEFGSINLTNCNFINNNATYDGGAICNLGNINLTGCNFTNNTATNTGGAIYNEYSVNLTNCIFINNTATRSGGAIYNIDDYVGNVNLTDCAFINNNATNGGAIYNGGGRINLIGCNFTNNTATSYGGAIVNDGANVSLTACNFTNNTATGGGGAIYNGADNANLTANNCTFINNTVDGDGGAIYNDDSITTLTGCNFTNNSANNGGAIYNYYGSATLTTNTCIFTDNSADMRGSAICNNGIGVTLNVSYSVFYNNEGNKTIYIDSGTCYLNDNFYFWVNPDINNMDSLKENITNRPNIINSFYYLSITNSSVSFVGDTLNISSSLSHFGSGRDDSRLPNLNNIGISYNGNVVGNYNYKTGINLPIRMNNTSNSVDFYYENYPIYQLPINVVVGLNYSNLEAAIVVGNSYNNQSAYTSISWTAFQVALNSAKSVNSSRPAANQGVIDAAVDTLNTARSRLVLASTQAPVNYGPLVSELAAASALSSSQYTASSWNIFQSILNSVIAMNNNRNAYSQSEINTLLDALNTAKRNLVLLGSSNTKPSPKPNVDLKITNVKRSGNSYKVTVKNLGKDKSTKTELKIWYKVGKKVFSKTANVKAIKGGKTQIVTVKFFKFSTHRKIIKTAHVNHNKMAYEKNYRNNQFKIKKA